MKLVLFIANILSGFTFYWFLKEIGKDSISSILGTVVYLFIPWRIHYGAGIGTYPLFLIFLFLPLAFIALERLLKKPSLANCAGLGLVLSLLILSHLIYALWSFLFLLLWFIFHLLVSTKKIPLKTFYYGFLSVVFALLNSAFLLLPFLLKLSTYNFPQFYGKSPIPNPLVLFGFLSETGGYSGTYLGWSVILLVGIAVYSCINNKQIFKNIAIIGLMISLLLTFIPAFLTRGDALLTAGLPTQRFLIFFLFFSGILTIDGYLFLKAKLKNSSILGKSVFYLILLIIIFDCLPRVIFPLYEKRSELLGLREEIYEVLNKKRVIRLVDIDIPTEGIDIVRRVCKYPAYGFLFGNLPTIYGPPYHQFAPKNMLYVYPWLNSLATDLGDSTRQILSDNSLKIIRLCGISHIISLPTLIGWGTDSTIVCLKEGLNWDNRFIIAGAKPPLAIGEYPYNPLFLASNVKKALPSEMLIKAKSFYIANDWEQLLSAISIKHEQGICNFIPIREGLENESLPGPDPTITVKNLSISHSVINAELISSKDCFLRVAVSYYPELKVQIDEREVSGYETKDHFLTCFFPAGEHRIKIHSELNKLDKFSFHLSFISMLGVILLGLIIPLLNCSSKKILKVNPHE